MIILKATIIKFTWFKEQSPMKRPPTDREILQLIYDKYYQEFCDYSDKQSSRQCKIYVPIDCHEIAKDLSIDPDIIFGRLYYHLDKKYGYTNDDKSKVHLFSLKTGSDKHTVHFPLLSAVLSQKILDDSRFMWSLILSASAATISLLSLFIG